MLNKVILQGRLVADPELRQTTSGTAVVSFRIACDRDSKSKDPNAQNVDFISVVAWRQTAEFINRYFTKGSMILVEGHLQVRDYTDKNGNRRSATEVMAERVNFCGSKGSNSSAAPSAAPAVQPTLPYQTQPQPYQAETGDDDLPF
jgi:single-strand DNA-binding protein